MTGLMRTAISVHCSCRQSTRVTHALFPGTSVFPILWHACDVGTYNASVKHLHQRRLFTPLFYIGGSSTNERGLPSDNEPEISY